MKNYLFRLGILFIFLMTACASPAANQDAGSIEENSSEVVMETAAPSETPETSPEATVETSEPEPTAAATMTPTAAPTRTPTVVEGSLISKSKDQEAKEESANTEGEKSETVNIPGTGEVDKSTLLLPDLITLPPFDLRYIIDDEHDHKYIRFSNAVYNNGTGDMEFFGEMDSDGKTINVTQWISTTTGSYVTLEVGEFIFHQVHNHYHWEEFSDYQVWSTDESFNIIEPVATSDKVSYCLRDFEPVKDLIPDYEAPEITPKWPKYDSCYWKHQGLSVGWSDTYKEEVAGQVVDISELENGVYALISTADPANKLQEADEYNNTAVIYFKIEGRILSRVEEP
ncbi:MAG: hypothetical protein EHM41_21145 [Chloroflexi bacterium]|nr:MAG: hypothetical protein EHM41_21145 [Chloroflexota bacterium]